MTATTDEGGRAYAAPLTSWGRALYSVLGLEGEIRGEGKAAKGMLIELEGENGR